MKTTKALLEVTVAGANVLDNRGIIMRLQADLTKLVDNTVKYVLLSSKDQLKVRKSHINSIAEIHEQKRS